MRNTGRLMTELAPSRSFTRRQFAHHSALFTAGANAKVAEIWDRQTIKTYITEGQNMYEFAAIRLAYIAQGLNCCHS